MVGLYKIPGEVLEDISLYKIEVERFLKGDVPPEKFKAFRVARGIYAQRGQSTYMVRIKIPAGGLIPEQMERIADLSEKYGNGIPHVTTRQDVQLHWVKIEDTVKAMEELADVGLTTRGGGGNTVRNITACPDAGVCEKEAFDVAPYAIALSEFFLKHPKAFTLPRKFKIAFSGCRDDCALATINDLGFIARRRTLDGKEEKGFQVYGAGGMGAYSRVAALLEDFIPAEDAIYAAEAMINLFDKHGNRKNKHKARLRFVMDKYGYDEFKRLYKEELEALKREGPKRLDLREVPILRDLGVPSKTRSDVSNKDLKEWMESNVRPQKQEGFYYIKIRLIIGDIPAEKLRGLAKIVRGFGEGTIRTTQDQNIIIRWVKAEELYPLYYALSEIDLAKGRAGGIEDVLSCPGAATCNLGVCLSRNMAMALSKDLERSGLPLRELQGINIKISGCPNACGQHPIGTIGLYGAARRVNGRLAPYYRVLLGGMVKGGETALGEPMGFVPARAVPSLIRDFLWVYMDERGGGEGFYSFLERRGKEDMKGLLSKHSLIPPYEGNREFYMDWGADGEFSLAGLGPGECGAGVFDMIETDLDDAKRLIYKAAKALEEGGEGAGIDIYKALTLASKALLITRGIEPKDDLEAFEAFEERFIKKGYIPEKFSGLHRKGAEFLSGLLDERATKEGLEYVKELVERVSRLYESMDDSLRFRREAQDLDIKPEGEALGLKEGVSVFMDLRGVKCPINYVKAKIRLEEMEVGETLLLYLDEGEPIRNVPSSLKNDGQEILRMEKVGDYYELLVRKLV